MAKDKDQPKDIVRPYVVDGIEEYDNPLPPWWVWLFNLTIVFGVGYFAWFHVMAKPGLEDELHVSRAAYQEQKSLAAAQTKASGGDLKSRLKDQAAIAEGKEIYTTNCSPCHGPSGGGVVGPNLTDEYWIHGGSGEQVMATIANGVPAKGMIGWESILGAKKIEAVTAYVLSLHGSQPPQAKAPEGEVYKDE